MSNPFRRLWRQGLPVVVGAAALAAMGSASGQTLVNIGYLPGYGGLGYATGVNADGSVVTGWTGSGQTRAFRWTTLGGLQNLGTVSGATFVQASGISRDGLVATGSLNISNGHGFRWSGGTMTDIGLYYAGSDWTGAAGISGDGLTIFGRTRTVSGALKAMTWSGGVFTLLPNPFGGFNTEAMACTPTANYVVGTYDPPGGAHAVRWGPSGQIDINALFTATYPAGISDDGQTVAGYGFTPSFAHFFRWRDTGGAGTMSDLGVLPGMLNSYARALVADGTAIVGTSSTSSTSAATLWTTDLGMLDLNTWLPTVGVSVAGWSFLSTSEGISADGTAIIGSGIISGQRSPFVVQGLPCLHKPGATTGPSDLTVCEGTNASFSASYLAQNYMGVVKPRWKRNGVTMTDGPTGWGSTISGAATGVLIITGATPTDAASYTCTFTNPCGSATTTAAQLVVSPLPAVVSQPVSLHVCGGGTASFTFGTQYGSSVQWYYALNPTDPFQPLTDGPFDIPRRGFSVNVAGSTGGTLTLSNVFLGNVPTLTLYAVVTNACGSVTSAVVTLVMDSSPLVSIPPADVNQCLPTTAVFSVTATGGGLSYQWQVLNNFAVWTNLVNPAYNEPSSGFAANVSGATSPNLSFTVTSIGENVPTRQVRCVVTNACGSTIAGPATYTWRACPYVCPADYDGSGGAPDIADIEAFFNAWLAGDDCADVDCSGGVPDIADIDLFFALWLAGGCFCPDCP